jgi:DNA-binding MarR family transcriptional regulator
MRLSAAEIAGHPRLTVCVRQQASTLLSLHSVNPRIASIFATQQRWLLAHLALAQYFQSLASGGGTGLYATSYVELAASRGVASRNTADAFLKEMQKYGYIRNAAPGPDRRKRPVEPTKITLDMIAAWLATHLTTLDLLDGGQRCAAFQARPESVGAIHPLIAEGLLQSEAIRAPDPTFSLFTWLNEGGIVMDWLCAGLAEVAPGCDRVPSTVTSFAELGERINLSRSHLTRKLRRAEAMGSLGWFGERGKSTMWVSAGFLGEYHTQQSVKLAIIDEAFQAAGVPEIAQSQAG